MQTSPPGISGEKARDLRFAAPRRDSEPIEYRVQIQRTSGIEESAQRRLDDGAVARPFLERELAYQGGGLDVERNRKPRMALRFEGYRTRFRRRDWSQNVNFSVVGRRAMCVRHP